MPLLLKVLRLLVGVLGLFVVYLAAFTYETTDKRINSWLEDLWLRFACDTRNPAAIAKRLARVVLVLLNRISDRIFGVAQLSVRTLSVALCYAFSAVLLAVIPLFLFARLSQIDLNPILKSAVIPVGQTQTMVGQTQIIMAAAFWALGTLPAVHVSLRWVTYLAALAILVSSFLAWIVLSGRMEAIAATSIEDTDIAAYFVTLGCGIGLLHLIRYSLRKSVEGTLSRRDLAIFCSILMIPAVAFVFVGSVSTIASHPLGHVTLWLSSFLNHNVVRFLLFSLGVPISLWGLGLFIAAALTLIVLLHLAIWPVIRFFLMKVLYAAQRHQLIGAKGRLWSAGLGLFACVTVPGELWHLATLIASKLR